MAIRSKEHRIYGVEVITFCNKYDCLGVIIQFPSSYFDQFYPIVSFLNYTFLKFFPKILKKRTNRIFKKKYFTAKKKKTTKWLSFLSLI